MLVPIFWAAAAMAQTAPGPTVIRTETRMVLVDAVVTNRTGTPLRDLTAKEFHVWEDGKEQAIQSVSYVADPATANQPTYLVLFFDNVSLDATSQGRARDAALQFAEANAGPNHYMAVVNYTGDVAISQNFTVDTDRLKRVVNQRASAIQSSAQLPGGRGMTREATGGNDADGLAHALRVLASNLSSVPGRKSLVLFSGGYPEAPQLNVQLHTAIEACNRNDVAIYPVDVSGFTQGVVTDAEPSRPAARAVSRRGIASTAADAAISASQILFALAQPTGGYVSTNPNDVVGGLIRIAKEQKEYYLLGYTPPETPDGSCHPLKVRVDRAGANVRARVSYCNVKAVDLLAGKPVEQELEYRVTGDDPGTLKASMQLPYFYTEADTARLNVAMDIPSASIHFDKVKGKPHGEMNIVGIAYLPDGSAAARFSDTLKLDFPGQKEMDAFLAKPLHYEKEFFIAPGNYTFKVAFTSGSEAFGKLQAPLAIQPYNGKEFMLSGLTLSREVRPASELGTAEDAELIEGRTPLIYKEMKIIPAGGSHFVKSDKLVVYGEVYEPLLGAAPPPLVEVRMQVVDQDGAVKFTVAMRPEVAGKPAGGPLAFAFKLPDTLAPGAYRVDVEAVDSAGKDILHSAAFELK